MLGLDTNESQIYGFKKQYGVVKIIMNSSNIVEQDFLILEGSTNQCCSLLEFGGVILDIFSLSLVEVKQLHGLLVMMIKRIELTLKKLFECYPPFHK